MHWDVIWALSGLASGPLLVAVGRDAVGPGAAPVVITSICAGLTGAMTIRFSGEPHLPAVCWLAITGVPLAAIDLACLRLPRALTGGMALGGVLLLGQAALLDGDLPALGRAVAAAGGVFVVMLGFALVAPSFGAGDVRLLAAVSLFLGWLGWHKVGVGLLLALLLASVSAGLLVVFRRLGVHDPVALGPSVLGGVFVALLLP